MWRERGRTIWLRTRVSAVILAAFGSLLLVGAGTASASATSCAFYGDGIKGMVRNGQFCGSIAGYSTRIDSVKGNFGTTIPGRNVVCNPSMKIDVYTRWSQWVSWRQGAQRGGCYWGTWNSAPSFGVNWDFPAAHGGYALISLQDSGRTVTQVRINLA